MKKRKRKGSGNGVEIVTDPEDAEIADMVVCRRLTDPLLEPDNHVGFCTRCRSGIQHRPDAPKFPPKVCDDCRAFKHGTSM